MKLAAIVAIIVIVIMLMPFAHANTCGNSVCDREEAETCPEDCMVTDYCGDGVCDYGELCAKDCTTTTTIILLNETDLNQTTTTIAETTTTLAQTTTTVAASGNADSTLMGIAVAILAAICGIAYYFIHRKSQARARIRKLYEEG
ncbi:MAG: hypothetical protein HZB66_03690 [Candidatus Aenigmarchaeota archaeon]|nr:hypothetical protein [Candidatus Aenigmarchaeota archaeon]